ncbi:serine/threonine-protein kinase [Spirillospora sp. NPDC048911]|uniref:serine/threonine-protein kinase n=1 Tax=Spirillospora sp. NPDC048911 TaxID=3364527 RepID=UPI00371FA3A3
MTDWNVSGFEEVRELGRGAQGRVVLARHTEKGTPVAIKYLPADADLGAQERFRHEARMLGQIDNPHVARLYRLVETDQGVAIIMEAVEGVPFKTILERYGTLEPEAALTVLKGSLLGLAAAHTAGVVHRDYKPANVVVPADGRSKLIDFGIATPEGASSSAGTPRYMAPEQWRGGPASPATDVYAATCVFFESITGRRPYEGGDQASLMNGHLNEPVPLDDLPTALRPLVAKGMAKEPGERPASAAVFVGELEEVARGTYGPDWESRGVRALAGTALALAALFPLAAAGLAPGASAAAAGAGASTASSTGVLTALGTKTTVAIAGTAVVGATAGGIGVYQATKPEPKPRPVAAKSSPAAPPTQAMTLGKIRIAAPLTWRFTRLTGGVLNVGGGSYRVNVPGRCTGTPGTPEMERDIQKTAYATRCPGFALLTGRWIYPTSENFINPYTPSGPFHPGTDPSHFCPPDPDKYNGVRRLRSEKPAVRRFAQVGSSTAEYREWRLVCMDYSGKNKGTVAFTQRLWYLPTSKILIVDEWGVPGLEQVLAKATWL